MRKTPLVSVVMPSYNHERFISEAIESVLGQSRSDLELIIIDDASKDNSIKIIKDYMVKDDRIVTIFHERNMGIAKTVNDGLNRARGKFIAFIGSDDLWVKDKLKKQLKILDENEELVVWSEGEIIYANGNPTEELFTQMQGASKIKKSGDIFKELLKKNFICMQSVIIKRKNIKKIRFDKKIKYLNDYKFFVDLSRKYNYYFISEPLAKYRIHGGNTILTDREFGWSNDFILINKYFIKKYGDEISNKIKSRMFLTIGRKYLNFGKKTLAKPFIYQAIKLNPIHISNITNLFLLYTREGGYIRKITKNFYH